jgi:hypothetical protein
MTESKHDVMEEWVAYPDEHVVMPLSQHSKLANAPGWWCLADHPERGHQKQTPEEVPS